MDKLNNDNTWVITGGAGFIGTNFVRHTVDKVDARLLVLDDLTYAGNFRNIESLVQDNEIDFIKGSICDAELVRSIFDSNDVTRVINFAAESHVDRSITNPRAFVDTNVVGSFVLLKGAMRAWDSDRNGRLFLHVSTDEVFGDLSPEDDPKNELSPYRPSSPYSASKAASDHLCSAWSRTYGLPVVITNCSNNYGPYQFPEKLIPLMINQAKNSQALPIYGDGLQIRDWLHVSDHCAALLEVLLRGAPGQTYCIGSGSERTNRNVVELLCDAVDEILGQPIGTSRELMVRVTDRPGHDRRYALDSSKISSELGWAPKIDFTTGLSDTVRWYFDNVDWMDEITSGSYQLYFEEQYMNREKTSRSGS